MRKGSLVVMNVVELVLLSIKFTKFDPGKT